MIPAEMLKRVIRTDAAPSPALADVSRDDVKHILEIACLAVASDGHIADEELAAVRVLGEEMCASAGVDRGLASSAAVERLAHECASLRTRDDKLERLRVAADALSSDAARGLAYKVSIATAMSDLASTDQEFEFDIDVQDALKLTTDLADRLAAEVHEALLAAET
jgi:hypothetical protein